MGWVASHTDSTFPGPGRKPKTRDTQTMMAIPIPHASNHEARVVAGKMDHISEDLWPGRPGSGKGPGPLGKRDWRKKKRKTEKRLKLVRDSY